MRTYLEEKRLYAENKTLGARVKMRRESNDILKKMFGRVPALVGSCVDFCFRLYGLLYIGTDRYLTDIEIL